MPVTETIELSARLGDETEVDLAAVVVNRVLPELFGAREEAVFEAMRAEGPAAQLREELGRDVDRVFDGADLAVRMRRSRAGHIARLHDELPAGTPLVFVPELFTRAQGIRATRMVADALSDEIL